MRISVLDGKDIPINSELIPDLDVVADAIDNLEILTDKVETPSLSESQYLFDIPNKQLIINSKYPIIINLKDGFKVIIKDSEQKETTINLESLIQI